MSNDNSNLIRLGGLWLNESKNGEKYFSGGLGNGRLLVFRNKHKEKDSDPDYVLYIAPKQQQQTGQGDDAPPRDMSDIPF